VPIDLLQPDRFKKQAMESLRQIRFELRNTPCAVEYIATTNGEVALNPAVRDCDIWTMQTSRILLLDRTTLMTRR